MLNMILVIAAGIILARLVLDNWRDILGVAAIATVLIILQYNNLLP